MDRLTEHKIVLITRKARLDDIIVRFNTLDQARFYVEHLGADFSDYQTEDRVYKRAVSDVESALKQIGRVQLLERSYVPNFIFGKNDVIVVIGQDGLVANTLKYLDQQPVIAINPDPKRWDGALLPFQVSDASKVILDLLQAKREITEITFAKVELNNGQRIYGVNDIFIGPKSHTSAQYTIEINGKKELQSSSGIIVSTGLGSTGWLKSIMAGARSIAKTGPCDKEECKSETFNWSSNYLRYNVREPFPSNITGTHLVSGSIRSTDIMYLTSQMARNGVIFSDGIESDFLEFNAGTKAAVTVADKKGLLVV